MGDVHQVQAKHIISREISTESSRSLSSPAAICRSRSLVSPQRSEIFEPGGETDSELECIVNDNNDILVESIVGSFTNDDSIVDISDKIADKCLELDIEHSNHIKGLDKSESTDTTYDEVTGFPVFKRKLPTPRQFSVDYFEVDENGFEIINPIFEEDETEANISCVEESNNGYVSTGLTQSIESISENPSYQYGNQTEYCVNGDYRDYGYYTTNETAKESFSLINHTPYKNKSYSLSVSHGNDEIEMDISCDKTKFSRMYSSDSYFRSRNKLGGFLRETDEDGVFSISSQNVNVKSTIVPLAIYNSGSMDQCTVSESPANC